MRFLFIQSILILYGLSPTLGYVISSTEHSNNSPSQAQIHGQTHDGSKHNLPSSEEFVNVQRRKVSKPKVGAAKSQGKPSKPISTKVGNKAKPQPTPNVSQKNSIKPSGTPRPSKSTSSPASSLNDNYQVPCTTAAVDTCNRVLVCKSEATEVDTEIEDENAKRNSRVSHAHLEKRRDPILALGGSLVMEPATYYYPFELYVRPRTNLARAVFDFSPPVTFKSHVMHDLKKDPVFLMNLVTEHIIELQTMRDFTNWDKTVETDLIKNWKSVANLQRAKQLQPPWAHSLRNSVTFNDIVFHALGSKINPGANVLCNKEVNAYKALIWAGKDAVDKTEYEKLVGNVLSGAVDSAVLHTTHRNVLAVFVYLKDPVIVDKMQTSVDEVRLILGKFKDLTSQEIRDKSGNVVDMDAKFHQFIKTHFETVQKTGQRWMKNFVDTHTRDQFKKKIQQLQLLKKDLGKNENQRGNAKKAYMKSVRDKRQPLEANVKTIKAKRDQLQTDVNNMLQKLLQIETDVSKQKSISAKERTRKREGWKAKVKEFDDKRKALDKEQKSLQAEQRKIDLLFVARVDQIVKNLEKDVALFTNRAQNANNIIKMPVIR